MHIALTWLTMLKSSREKHLWVSVKHVLESALTVHGSLAVDGIVPFHQHVVEQFSFFFATGLAFDGARYFYIV